MDPRDDDPRRLLTRDTVHKLFELTGRLRALMDASAAELELTPMQARALFMTQAPVPMGFLAESLHCDASNITGIVDRLEDRGLMERVMDPDDRRRRNLSVTPAGREVADQLRERLARGNPIMRLEPDDLARLHAMLLQMLGPDDPQQCAAVPHDRVGAEG